MSGVALPPWQLFGLRQPSLGVYRLYGKVRGKLPRGLCHQGTSSAPHPCGESLPTHASTRDPPKLAGSFGSVSCGVTASLLWLSVHTKFCLYPPRLESLFPLVLQKSYNQISLALKARFPEDSQPLCGKPRLECSEVQNLHNSVRTSLVLLLSSLWVTHLVDKIFDFIMTVPLLLSHCRFFFVFRYEVFLFVCLILMVVLASSCLWLFNSQLQFWCYRRGEEKMNAHPSPY